MNRNIKNEFFINVVISISNLYIIKDKIIQNENYLTFVIHLKLFISFDFSFVNRIKITMHEINSRELVIKSKIITNF